MVKKILKANICVYIIIGKILNYPEFMYAKYMCMQPYFKESASVFLLGYI